MKKLLHLSREITKWNKITVAHKQHRMRLKMFHHNPKICSQHFFHHPSKLLTRELFYVYFLYYVIFVRAFTKNTKRKLIRYSV